MSYLIRQSKDKYNINNNWTHVNQYIGQEPLHSSLFVRIVTRMKTEDSVSIVFWSSKGRMMLNAKCQSPEE